MASIFSITCSVVLLSPLLLSLRTLPPAEAQLTSSQKNFILQQHNQMRSRVRPSAANMQAMHWDDNLARVAQAYSQRCVYKHNQARTSQFHRVGGSQFWKVGENIAYSSNPNADATIQWALNAFYDEREDFDFNNNRCQPGRICGHYTQMVWDNTVAVGCGITQCSPLANAYSSRPVWFLTCNYAPGGNYGRQPYKAGPQCSQCPEEAPFCVEGLCSKTTTSATEADTEGRGNPQQGTRNDETLTVQIPAQVTLEVRHRPVENRPAPQPTPNKVVLIKPHQNNVQRPAPQAQTQRSSQTPEKTSVSTEQTVRSSQQSRNSVRFAAHLETKRFVTKFSNGDITPRLIWNPNNARNYLDGDFELQDGSVIIPKTGIYFVNTQLWKSRSGESSLHYLYADGGWLATSKEVTSGHSFSSSSGFYTLHAGQHLTVRLAAASTPAGGLRTKNSHYNAIRESSITIFSV